jgi:nucleotide-binding universal stress UspA family protein
MERTKKTIIVPCDFTEVTQYALDLTVRLSRILNTDYTLVHIIDEGNIFTSEATKRTELEEANLKLQQISDETFEKYQERPKFIARIGHLYETINAIADELEARMVVMGIHEFKGMQRFTGSRALKVMAGSKIPFIMVSSAYQYRVDNDIVLPIDHKLEDKEKLIWANYMAKNFGSKINIFAAYHSDELLRKRTIGNVNFAKKYLDEKGVAFEVHMAEKGENFSDETVRFAKEINTNLILIMITKEINLQDFLLGAEEQKVIFNDARIAVMCVNPRTDLTKSGGFN